MSLTTLVYLLIYPLSLYATTTCKFSQQRLVYDLCPLLQVPGFTVGEYRFNSQNDKGPGPCPKDTWICLNGSQEYPITVAVPHLSTIYDSEMEQKGLQIQFRGGIHNGTFHSALIHFVCDTDSRPEHLSALKPLSEHDVIHSFRWATKHACPSVLTDHYIGLESLHIAESEIPPGQGGEQDEGENLMDPTVKPRLSARATALTVSIIGMLLLSTCYFIYNPPTRLIDQYLRPNLSRLSLPNLPGINRFNLPRFNPMAMSKKFKSRRRARTSNFRVGENRLVQWAQEDMLEDDIDVMVNANDNEDAILDEYVPLSAGMGWQARRPRDYGTTQFP
ncbi:hypothetical protein L218DRAFT_1078912 [Marasmius fiardii PR-910]|nr:hypothetical protein L218DRAFT_1078912 [Marasmius fiardii PR-910]